MGERIINPVHNVFKKYRKVNLVNPYWFQKPFVSTWRTSNLSTGSSTNVQVKLPLVSTGSYNFTVDWGDGTSNVITAWNQAQTTHTYAVAGDYTLTIKGNCTGWVFNNTGDRLKILSITSWGGLKLGTNQGFYFFGCANLNLSSVSDVLNLTGTTSLTGAFASCTLLSSINKLNEWDFINVTTLTSFLSLTSFNQPVNLLNTQNVTATNSMFSQTATFNSSFNMNTSSVTNMGNMFFKCTAFNQNLSSLDVSKVTNFFQMFQETSFNNAGNSGIGNWVLATTGNINCGRMFQQSTFNQNIGAWNVSNVTDFSFMFTQTSAFNNGGSNTINNWILKNSGTIVMNSMFQSATGFNQPLGNWNTAFVTNMSLMFASAILFNQNIGAWDVTKVTNCSSTFNGATAFNNGGSPDIDNWRLTVCTTTQAMFAFCSNFNQPLGSWTVGNVTTFGGFSNLGMFQSCFAFNQNIGAWNVTKGTSFERMFSNCAVFNNGGSNTIDNWRFPITGTINMNNMFNACPRFNQPIGSWNTARVTGISSAFQNCTDFNQNIGAWDVSNMSSFNNTFNNCVNFNNGGSPTIDNWRPSSCTNMFNMFAGANVFNQPIGSWTVGNVNNMSGMFSNAAAFNQNIGAWDVSKVTNFSSMFRRASGASMSFNNGGSSDIDNWRPTAATTIASMFESCFAFNQPIGSWDVSSVTTASNFFGFKTAADYSATNLDLIYNGWSSRPVKPSVSIGFHLVKHTAASSAGRAILTGSPNLWIITDGGI